MLDILAGFEISTFIILVGIFAFMILKDIAHPGDDE